MWESSPHSKIRGQPFDLDVALPVLFGLVFNFDSVPGYLSCGAYMLSEVSMPIGQSVCNRDRISARSSCNKDWILEGKLLIGATITRWDAGMIF